MTVIYICDEKLTVHLILPLRFPFIIFLRLSETETFLARLEKLPERQSELQKTFLEFELDAIK